MKKKPRILLWDIETSHLAADYGWCLCIAYKWLDEKKVHLLKIRSTKEFKKDRTNDSGLIKKFVPIISKADLHVYWFGEYFDLPFIQTRLLMAGEKPLPNIPFVDGWRIARKKLKLRSNRLDAVSKIIPLPKSIKREEKLQPRPEDWRRANAGHHDALKVIEDRCKSDVLVLEQIYKAIRPWGSSLPNLSKITHPELDGCNSCGSKRVQLRGYRVTVRGKQRQAQCQDCGHWFAVAVKKPG